MGSSNGVVESLPCTNSSNTVLSAGHCRNEYAEVKRRISGFSYSIQVECLRNALGSVPFFQAVLFPEVKNALAQFWDLEEVFFSCVLYLECPSFRVSFI